MSLLTHFNSAGLEQAQDFEMRVFAEVKVISRDPSYNDYEKSNNVEISLYNLISEL
jgi:hypothetical protein